MKIVHKDQTQIFKNGENCIAIEYPMGDKDINGAVAEINGRYPDTGRVFNTECKELFYVIEGTGTLTVEGEEVKLAQGDLVLVEPEEKYFFNGHLKLFVPCAPAWNPTQHKKIDE